MTILETPIIIPKASKSLVFTSNNPPDPTRSLTCVTQEPAFELRTHQALPLWKLPAMGGITNAQSQLIKAILWHSFEHLQVCCWHFFCQFFFGSIFTYYTLIVPLFDSPPPSPTFSDAMVSAFSAQYARDFDLQNSRPARWKIRHPDASASPLPNRVGPEPLDQQLLTGWAPIKHRAMGLAAVPKCMGMIHGEMWPEILQNTENFPVVSVGKFRKYLVGYRGLPKKQHDTAAP